MSSVLLNAPAFLSKYFSEQDYFCIQHWPEQWMAKTNGLTWLIIAGVFPMITMGVLYSRVVYSLWIKREGRTNGSQKVQIIGISNFCMTKLIKNRSLYAQEQIHENKVNQGYGFRSCVDGRRDAP